MKKLFISVILAGLLGVGTVLAAKTPMVMIAESPDKTVKVILFEEPCDGVVAAMLRPPIPPEVKQASYVSTKSLALEACWMALPEGVAILLETGEQGLIPYELFKPAEKI